MVCCAGAGYSVVLWDRPSLIHGLNRLPLPLRKLALEADELNLGCIGSVVGGKVQVDGMHPVELLDLQAVSLHPNISIQH